MGIVKYGDMRFALTMADVTISSRELARQFEKQHGHVLRDIKNVVENLRGSNSGSAKYFKVSTYLDEQGKTRKEVRITQLGFMLLSTCYTGRKALERKERMISAFGALIEDWKKAHLRYQNQYALSRHDEDILISLNVPAKKNVTPVAVISAAPTTMAEDIERLATFVR